jgi:hypothetical protein
MEFPKLLYVGDVSVESTVAGSALLYRLLMTWPKDRLRIVESNLTTPTPAQRLPGVEYRQIVFRMPRLLQTRIGRWWAGRLFKAAQNGTSSIVKLAGLQEFKPDAVLTVAQSYSWVTASNVAKRLGIPLHLIVHDDAVLSAGASKAVTRKVAEVFAEVYRSATSRLCVCSYMAEYFQKEFGVTGDALYPSRAAGIDGFKEPSARLTEVNRPLTYGYAGSLWTPSPVRSLATLSTIAQARGDRVLVFSNLSADGAKANGLVGPHIEMHPIIPFRQLIEILRDRIDVLFVPMSFESEHQLNARIAFPTKITYTTTFGVPLFSRAPAKSSDIRWAK